MNKRAAMEEGGKKLGDVRAKLYEITRTGMTPWELEQAATRFIKEAGAEPSFTKVKGYHWATCINLNEGIVHGIPTSTIPLKSGDMVTVDVGLYYKGYHTDSAFTKVVGTATKEQVRFLEGGMAALSASLLPIKPGCHVGEIGSATESVLRQYGYYWTRELTGHGVGRELHEEPMIPNHAPLTKAPTPQLVIGQTLAIEVIYCSHPPRLYLEADGWTISSKNDKLTAVFEETVMVTPDGYSLITKPSLSQIVTSGTIGDKQKQQ